MAPEYGATCGIFPIDNEVLNYLKLTGRDQENIDLVAAYAKAQKMFVDQNYAPKFANVIKLDLSSVKPSISGPKRPQDQVFLEDAPQSFAKIELANQNNAAIECPEANCNIKNGDIVIAAITSCTNTSNPAVLVAAGLVAKKAAQKGLKIRKSVKTSFAPGSQAAAEYLQQSGLQNYLDDLGFNVVGFGCATCIGNSGPLHPQIEEAIKNNDLTVGAVLSGNRNFEGRVHPLTKANYLASPPLVVAYALAGNLNINLAKDAIGTAADGTKIYLKDIWPSNGEIKEMVDSFVTREVFAKKYQNIFAGDKSWKKIATAKSDTYDWQQDSTYIRLPGFFADGAEKKEIADIKNAKILALFGDSITTDHISPAGNIAINLPAAKYLQDNNVDKKDFNSYGARRGNHEVMMRGTFANIRIKNEIIGGGKEGGYTKLSADGQEVSIYDAAMKYKEQNMPLVIFAGKEYGTGSSRDWAAKGTSLLGVKAVIAESFERIHRSNLIGMGVLPLVFKGNQTRKSLNLTGFEKIDIIGIDDNLKPRQDLRCIITKEDGSVIETNLLCRIDTKNEIEYYKFGGILQFVMNNL
jgi:aconitate hydratase